MATVPAAAAKTKNQLFGWLGSLIVTRPMMFVASIAAIVCVSTMLIPAHADEPAMMKPNAIFPGGNVKVLPGGVKDVVGQKNGISFRHNFDAISGAVVSNEPGASPEKIARDNGWWVSCTRDPMNDSIACFITREVRERSTDKALTVFFTDGSVFCVPQNNHPEWRAMVRIDKNKPLATSLQSANCFSKANSAAIRSQLRGAKQLWTRHHEWPSEAEVDTKIDTYGLDLAFEMLEWIRNNVE
jgi:hypothetical protein